MSDAFNQYHAFIEALQTSTDIVWAIADEEGYASCESNDMAEREVLLIWSDEALARAACIEEWADYQPSPIRVEDFVEYLLPQMHEDGVLVGVNWNADLEGAEQEALLLMDDLLDEED